MLIARRLVLSTHPHRLFTTSSCYKVLKMDKYRDLSREELVARLAALETPIASTSQLSSTPTPPPTIELTAYERKKAKKHAKTTEKFDLTKYPCRKIALRFSYDGASYSGLATQKGTSGTASDDIDSVTTVEDVLWKALAATRLVGEDQSMGDVGWSRCGRTDRGVSAGGQVIALWVRSRRVDQWEERRALERFIVEKKREQGIDVDEDDYTPEDTKVCPEVESAKSNGHLSDDSNNGEKKRIEADPESEELAYVSTLNAVLPSNTRVQAWSPVRTHFSARFDCRFRHYKYFFTSGCPFVKQTSTRGPISQLDIPLMRLTAQKFLGDHDFRNFCKVDPSKQIDNYRRRIDGISIDEVSDPWPVSQSAPSGNANRSTKEMEKTDQETMYVLNLRGTAFLYHQVRHMVAILFLVGAKLEKPSIVDELLNVEKGGLARDRLLMRRRGLVLDDDNIQTTLPKSTATTMTGYVASDGVVDDVGLLSTSEMNLEELSREEKDLLDLVVYNGKPEYRMASDRPLMLWECGFKSTDIQWRSGTYDGPFPLSNGEGTLSMPGDINSSTGPSMALLHAQWSSLSITAELYKHFLLALPLDAGDNQPGYIPSSLLFDQSAMPFLQKSSISEHPSSSVWTTPSFARQIIPLGDGQFRAVQGYKGLIKTKREETPDVKNAKFLQGRGKRRAERKALAVD